jgi:hypothetical protein
LGEVVGGAIYYGIKTGLNEAFVVDQGTRDGLVQQDPACASLLKPLLRGEDLRPWYQETEGKWMIVLPSGWTRATFGDGLGEADAWAALRKKHAPLAAHLGPFAQRGQLRQDKGQYWWELRSCDYYEALERPKILWPDIAKFPRFSWDASGHYLGNTGYTCTFDDPWLLGYLTSRCAWFVLTQTSIALGERAGLNRYRLFDQYVRQVSVPTTDETAQEAIGTLAVNLGDIASARHDLHRGVRHRVAADLGSAGGKLNQRLTAWWELDFAGLRAEVRKVFKQDIPLKDRDEWEVWFDERVAEHRRLTDEIVRLETELNAMVYALFDLTPDEIALIERSTKYRYGEV